MKKRTFIDLVLACALLFMIGTTLYHFTGATGWRLSLMTVITVLLFMLTDHLGGERKE